jgi:hypothetical protein
MRILWAYVKENWFYFLFIPICVGTYIFSAKYNWSGNARRGEVIALLYWCVFVPLLFLLCFRSFPARALFIRMFATICGGFWFAGLTVPDYAQHILVQWRWLRYFGIALLLIVEALAIIAFFRIAFDKNPDIEKLRQLGVPDLAAKAMIAEAKFWRWLWSVIIGKR